MASYVSILNGLVLLPDPAISVDSTHLVQLPVATSSSVATVQNTKPGQKTGLPKLTQLPESLDVNSTYLAYRSFEDTIHQVSDMIGMGSMAIGSNNTKNTSSTFEPLDEVEVSKYHYPEVDDTLSLTDDASANFVIRDSADNTMSMTDSVNIGQFYGVEQDATLTDTAVADETYTQIIEQDAELADIVGLELEPPVDNTLELSDVANVEFELDVSNDLALTQSAGRVFEFDITQDVYPEQILRKLVEVETNNTLSLTQDYTEEASKHATDDLDLTQELSQATSIFNRSVEDDLDIDHYALHRTGELCSEESYSTSIGIASDVELTYPYASPTTTISLRTPDFGNILNLDLGGINRRTPSGQLKIGRDSYWPKIKVLKMSFTFLSQTQKDNFIDFLEESAGKEIGLRDHENVQWRGVIITPENVTEQNKNGNCHYETAFEFRGVVV